MADVSQGTTISWAGTTIPCVQSFDGPGMTTPIIDVSDLSDTARNKISSALFDGGQITTNVFFEPDNAVHDAIADAVIAGTSAAIVVTFADAGTTTYSFNAFATELTPSGSTGEVLTTSITFDVDGTVTIA